MGCTHPSSNDVGHGVGVADFNPLTAWLIHTGKVVAAVSAIAVFSGSIGPCSTSYKFVSKTEANEQFQKVSDDLQENSTRLDRVEVLQNEMNENIKTILKHLLRRKKDG